MNHVDLLLVKGMVCDRCTFVLQRTLTEAGFPPSSVSLGRIHFREPLDAPAYDAVRSIIQDLGFDVTADRQSRLVQEIKRQVQALVDEPGERSVRLSDLLTEKLHLSYSVISQAFSRSEGTTIENYLISRRIDKVKEMLVYTRSSLGEISFQAGFSSVQHLVRQFRERTGQTPGAYRLAHPIHSTR